MLDKIGRPLKNRLLEPLTLTLAGRVHPGVLTLASVLSGAIAAAAVAVGHSYIGLLCWAANRILDGLDGAVARAAARQTDLGAYFDILGDFVVYAAIPISVAVNMDTAAAWIATAVLLATFYVNAASWMYLAALLEKRSSGARERGEETSITMPDALMGGTETLFLYTLLLAFPAQAPRIFWIMTILTAISIAQRMAWASRSL